MFIGIYKINKHIHFEQTIPTEPFLTEIDEKNSLQSGGRKINEK